MGQLVLGERSGAVTYRGVERESRCCSPSDSLAKVSHLSENKAEGCGRGKG